MSTNSNQPVHLRAVNARRWSILRGADVLWAVLLAYLTINFVAFASLSSAADPVFPTNFPPSPNLTSVLRTNALSRVGGTNTQVAKPDAGGEALDSKHKLVIGDRLSFRILEDEDEPRSLIVTDSADLELPYVGRFPAEGKTCKQLAGEIKAALEKEYYYQATVVVAVDAKAKTLGKVYLAGAVRVPGPQEIPSDEVLTLGKSILRAGGFKEYADTRHVRVTRKSITTGGDQQFIHNVAEVLEQGKTESDLRLEPGDLIFIPERIVKF